MHLFVLVSDQIPPDHVKAVYPNHSIQIGNGAWILADKTPICSEVTEKLGIDRGGHRGVVTGIHGYYGLWDTALWQRMTAWSEQPNG